MADHGETEQGSGLIGLETEETVLHTHFPWLIESLEWVAAGIDVFAIALLLIGAMRFVVGVTGAELQRDPRERVKRLARRRIQLGRYILAGLEVFIVSDIIHTALSLKFSDLLFLGLLVVIRSITSFFLDRELEQLKQEIHDDAE